ncbi:5-methylcytosine rRNA methyltransferase NSUN4 [Hyla sarda]|uniref:5-methylcytosine rRNA methyltransferase NSUN4 n=1 Tax=Hyla sarda TaxID=327740 RepID=UPI0024C3D2BF|nr:5-methylcytosine rRNA methyltransferase NSUN4 [Hyla sarda]
MMATSLGATLSLLKVRGPVRIFCRYRYKKKWATSYVGPSGPRLALQYFDMNYSAQFGDVWPSVRIGLLSEQKYGALINHFSGTEDTAHRLGSLGVTDFLQEARTAEAESPGTMSEALRSSRITCYTFPRGDISRFPPARSSPLGLLEYYLLDAASLLPVLALNVRPEHRVLDLCAAPGGKTLALLMEDCRYLGVNDASISRSNRLRRVLHSYVPPERRTEERLRVTTWDGTQWGEEGLYDRVLVDAPCTTDRHSLHHEDNNVFSRLRVRERQRLPLLQTHLLLSGLRAVVPGGDVVYSTCTLSTLQNECVVEGALGLAASEYGVHAEVQDLRSVREIFSRTFNFHLECRIGELVLPQLTANYGPLYLCKLRRLR